MRSRSMTVALSLGVAAACGDDDPGIDDADTDDGPTEETLLDRAAAALGGGSTRRSRATSSCR